MLILGRQSPCFQAFIFRGHSAVFIPRVLLSLLHYLPVSSLFLHSSFFVSLFLFPCGFLLLLSRFVAFWYFVFLLFHCPALLLSHFSCSAVSRLPPSCSLLFDSPARGPLFSLYGFAVEYAMGLRHLFLTSLRLPSDLNAYTWGLSLVHVSLILCFCRKRK